LDKTLRMKTPRRIAVSFMGDLFHKDVRDGWIYRVLDVTVRAPQHTYLFLTKRPARMALEVKSWFAGYPPRNCWWGTSVSNQADADKRLPELLKCPGNLWVSVEPMQGPLDLSPWLFCEQEYMGKRCCDDTWPGRGAFPDPLSNAAGGKPWTECCCSRLGWVVAGGGPFPVHPDDLRSIRDQCVAAGVPWWFKSWGDWVPNDERTLMGNHELARRIDASGIEASACGPQFRGMEFYRVGKKAAGCLLDGREWHQLPEGGQ
jgi:protein gp37